jgi:hypothetical protein
MEDRFISSVSVGAAAARRRCPLHGPAARLQGRLALGLAALLLVTCAPRMTTATGRSLQQSFGE